MVNLSCISCRANPHSYSLNICAFIVLDFLHDLCLDIFFRFIIFLTEASISKILSFMFEVLSSIACTLLIMFYYEVFFSSILFYFSLCFFLVIQFCFHVWNHFLHFFASFASVFTGSINEFISFLFEVYEHIQKSILWSWSCASVTCIYQYLL